MTLAADHAYRPRGVMRDILANLLGKGWVALISVLFVPYFLRFLGIEAYGLVGFFITLQTVLLLVDFGFSTTLNRELSAAGGAAISSEATSLAVSLERVFAGFALLIALVVLFAAPWLVSHWVVLDRLSPTSVEHALQLMGVAIALQLPFMLYAGGLTGLARQPYLNVILASCATLRFGGALLVLMVAPKIEAFFAWQIAAVALQTLWARWIFFRTLRGRSAPPHHVTGALQKHVGFAAGVGMTAALGVVLTQLDKLMLSKLLTLGEYGYYTLAWTLSAMLFMLAGPIVTAFFPRLSAEVARDGGDPAGHYHAGCQLLSAVVMPAGALLMLFPAEVLMLWIGDSAVAQHVNGLVVLLSFGTLLNTLAQLPHALQLAFGLPHFGLYANVLSVALAAPALYFGVGQAGVQGAAWVWVALNAAYVVVGVPIMHRWLLRGHLLSWMARDVLLPMATAFVTALLARQLLALQPAQSMHNFVLLALCYFAATGACVLVLPSARQFVLAWRRPQL